MKNIVKILFVLFFFFHVLNIFSQEDSEFSDRMRGQLPSNYFAIEAAFTPGFSGSAGVDGYIDVLKMFGKEKGFSWVINGQYMYSFTKEHDSQWNYSRAHNLGYKGGGYKIGTGFILFEKKSTLKFKYFFESKPGAGPDEGEKVVSRFYKGPISKSVGILFNYYTENSGSWGHDSISGPSFTTQAGETGYIMPTLRIQKAWNFLKEGINPDGQKGWRYFDIGIPFTPDMKQIGIRMEWFMKTGWFTSRIGFGAMYRSDLPDEPTASRKQEMRWYFPIWFTLGLGGNIITRTEGDRRFQDKVNVQKSLL